MTCMNADKTFLLLACLLAGLFLATGNGRAAPGDVDQSFMSEPPPSGIQPQALAIQPDGKILIGNSSRPDPTRTLLRLSADGSRDPEFAIPIIRAPLSSSPPGEGGSIRSIAIQTDGRILIAGRFTNINGMSRVAVARFEPDGALNTLFDPMTGFEEAFFIAVQDDGKIIVTGFTNSFSPYRIVRLNGNGTLDERFLTRPWSSFSTATLQRDGKLVVAGQIDGARKVVRLNFDGSPDTGFSSPTIADFFVNVIAQQADGKLVIGGSFPAINGISRGGIARLNSDGSLDFSFNPGTGINMNVLGVRSVASQPDGKVLIAGTFVTFDGAAITNIARLNSNGTLDSTFKPGAGANWFMATVVARQTDGKIVIGGGFGSDRLVVRLQGTDALPPLRIVRSSAGVVLSWPMASSEGAVLEAAESLTGATIWTRESFEPVLVGGDFVLPVEGNGHAKFYRLRKE